MGRVVLPIMAMVTAAMAATLTASIARDDFGIRLDAIRTDALRGAGLIFAAVACGCY
jgi:hypothetical protein